MDIFKSVLVTGFVYFVIYILGLLLAFTNVSDVIYDAMVLDFIDDTTFMYIMGLIYTPTLVISSGTYIALMHFKFKREIGYLLYVIFTVPLLITSYVLWALSTI